MTMMRPVSSLLDTLKRWCEPPVRDVPCEVPQEEDLPGDVEPVAITPEDQQIIDICIRLMGPDGEPFPCGVDDSYRLISVTKRRNDHIVVACVDVGNVRIYITSTEMFYNMDMLPDKSVLELKIVRMVDGDEFMVVHRSLSSDKDTKHPLYPALLVLFDVLSARAVTQGEKLAQELKAGVFDDLTKTLNDAASSRG